MILGNDPKRLLIYFFYDKDGIIDRYVTTVLEDLKKSVSRTVFVCNGNLAEGQSEKLDGLADKILERKNEGLDVWAYKQALEEEGYENLPEYDEVILANSTIMGPVTSTEEMFSVMNARDIDFWGISKFHKVEEVARSEFHLGYIPEHIQSHFIVMRKSMLSSESFAEYWKNVPKIKSYHDSVDYHESVYTLHFENLGFKSDVYSNTDEVADYNTSPINYMPVEMIERFRCPYFKRRVFFAYNDGTLAFTAGQPGSELMEYLKTRTDYDTNMIWDNILRCYDMYDIKNCLSLNYTLPSDKYIGDSSAEHKKVALIYHSHFPDLIDDTVRYINNMPDYADIYITANTDENIALLKDRFKDHKFNKLEIIKKGNRGRDVSSMLVAAKDFIMDYDIVCAAHDKKVRQLKPMTVGKGFAYTCLENTLGSKDFVLNVIDLFDKNPRMGLLTPPPPLSGVYVTGIGAGWGPNYDVAAALAEKLGLHVPMDKSHEPVAPIGSTFWFRPAGMKKMFAADWKYEDFPTEPIRDDGTVLHAIERLHGLVEQDAGYYCAWGMIDYASSVYMTALNYMLKGFIRESRNHGIGGVYADIIVANKSILDAYSGIVQAVNSCAGALPAGMGIGTIQPARMYYDVGDGLSEDHVTVKNIRCDGKLILEEFELDEPASTIRFDPTENKVVMVKDLNISVKYKDGSTKQIDLADCYANGRRFGDNDYIFVDGDPQIQYTSKRKNIVSVFVKCAVETQVSLEECTQILKWYDPNCSFGYVPFRKRFVKKIKAVLRPIKRVLVKHG